MFTGYGRHSCKIVECLDKAGFDVFVRPLEIGELTSMQKLPIPVGVSRHFVGREQAEPWELLLSPPKHLPTPGKKTVYFTMWESTRLSGQSVGLLNRAEAVIVPCKWCRKAFIDSGVKRPIFIVPLGVDTELFKPQSYPTKNTFVFGAAGRAAHGDQRKGLRDVIKAFEKAFGRTTLDVQLQIKGFADCPIGLVKEKRIVLIEKFLHDHEYAKWLAGLHCFVSAAKSEGWGWHQQEAMAIGRPLIACRYGGLAEFYDVTCGPNIPFTEMPAQEVWKGLGNWAQPDIGKLAKLMRWSVEHRVAMEKMGVTAARQARRFSDGLAAERLLAVLADVGMIR